MELFIDVKPVPKARPRLSKFGAVFTPKKTVIAEKAIHMIVMSHMHKHHVHMTFRPVIVEITFCYKYRKGTKEVDKLLPMHVNKRPDIDNLAKLVLDSLNGVAYSDDAQVVKLRCEKIYSEKEGINLRIIEI